MRLRFVLTYQFSALASYGKIDNINMPRRIQFTNGNAIDYIYTASGQKLRTIYYTAATEQKDSTEYLLGGLLTKKNNNLDKYLFDGGYYSFDNNTPTSHYYNRDHLGNIREVISQTGDIEQVTHYYPFGAPYSDSSVINPDLQPYKYNAKEFDSTHNLFTYDYGARQYDPLLVVWHGVDPMCENYPSIGGYVYCIANPVKNIDIDGEKPDKFESSLMSSLAYEDNNEYMRELNDFGWEMTGAYDNKISGLKYAIFKRTTHEEEELCVAFAGTDNNFRNISKMTESLIDMFTDAVNFVGGITAQHIEAIITALKWAKYKDLTFTGHSLGGGLATIASKMTGKEAIVFNAASISNVLNIIGNNVSSFHGGKITHYRSAGSMGYLNGDPVNMVQNFFGQFSSGKTIPVYTGKNFSHSIDDIIKAFKKKR